jgi:hypothetical protein
MKVLQTWFEGLQRDFPLTIICTIVVFILYLTMIVIGVIGLLTTLAGS